MILSKKVTFSRGFFFSCGKRFFEKNSFLSCSTYNKPHLIIRIVTCSLLVFSKLQKIKHTFLEQNYNGDSGLNRPYFVKIHIFSNNSDMQ